ncbi:tryptophanyl-tRNA synthetase [Methanomicrobium sp. W14]|uniref:tryptophan--tRNA ligase n=1 Tax=Methanomicrobium sp. W14 TaxID=2817839 RepID=UPI001AE3CB18|nr:tryptophan--tRNA ligase [Methanomicrobium sp. W14]MBP2134088.1 tryptophanyl-tRNA synthetase [Methanomicrobium sp. W14]
MQSEINPWSSRQNIDTEKLFRDFGIKPAGQAIKDLKNPPVFFRRGIVAGQRDYAAVADAIENHKKFYVMTGFMPSGHPHLGHLMVMKEVVWHTLMGGTGYISVADREAHAVRGISWDKCKEFGKEYLKCIYALGYRGNTYFQSENNPLKDLAFESATKINFSELSAIYGFTQETSLAHAMSVATQVADILYPQTREGPAPTVVPVGIDQDPHIRLTRDVAGKLRMFTVIDLESGSPGVSIRSKNAPVKAMDKLEKAFPGCKRYEGHIDVYGADRDLVEKTVRETELDCGGYGFYLPSATYHTFLQGLMGGKMSSSVPESLFRFDEPEKDIRKKIMNALTGGRMTLEEQKRLGGEPEKCSVYLLNLFHMQEDDEELKDMRCACREGRLMCGTCKKETFERVKTFLKDFNEKMDEVSHMVEE